MTRKFNKSWEAECDQFNLAHVTKTKTYLKKKLKQTNASAH